MRTVFLLILLVGLIVGIGYPLAWNSFADREIGAWRVYEQGGEFRPVTAGLVANDGPVALLVEMSLAASPEFKTREAVLGITATHANRTVLAKTLGFDGSTPQETSPQSRQKILREQAGVIAEVVDGDYTFVVSPGDAQGIQIQWVDLVLRRGAPALDPRLQPIGYALTAVGFIGLVIAMRRRRRQSTAPAPPVWGRNGGKPE